MSGWQRSLPIVPTVGRRQRPHAAAEPNAACLGRRDCEARAHDGIIETPAPKAAESCRELRLTRVGHASTRRMGIPALRLFTLGTREAIHLLRAGIAAIAAGAETWGARRSAR